jgi:hypothetical protein
MNPESSAVNKATPEATESTFHPGPVLLLGAPGVEHYRRQGRFAEIDGSLPVEDVTTATIAALTRLRGHKGI